MPDAPQPQPERAESTLENPRAGDLSRADYRAVAVRGLREALADNMPDAAAALAYYAFLALPALLLVALGVFGLTADAVTVEDLMGRARDVMPAEAVTLLQDSLTRTTQSGGGSTVMVLVGFVLALWTCTGAMSALMRALNTAYDRGETRGFIRIRLTALAMLGLVLLAVLLVAGLLVLGPVLSGVVGDALGAEGVVTWIWWTAQWPVLVLGLLAAFAALLYLGPDVRHPRLQLLTPGAVVAVVLWILASAAFAVYTSQFGSYNKAWGSLSAVIILLTWLWLSGLALLVGAEINAELERSRELRAGEPAEEELTAAPKGEPEAARSEREPAGRERRDGA